MNKIPTASNPLSRPTDPLMKQFNETERAMVNRPAQQPTTSAPANPPAPPPAQPEMSTKESAIQDAIHSALLNDGAIDPGEALDVLTKALDPEDYVKQFMDRKPDFMAKIAGDEQEMARLKEIMSRLNAAKDVFLGVNDNINERRKKLADSFSRI